MVRGEHQTHRDRGRVVFATLVVFLSWVGTEFGNGEWALWYQTEVAGVPLHYLLFAGIAVLLWPILWTRPRINIVGILKESHLWPWVIMGWLTLIVALVLGIIRRANEPFADWRNFLVLAVTAVVVAKLLSGRSWRRWALTDLAIGYGVLSVVNIVIWILGGGVQLFDLRVPVTDGYDLSLAVLAAAVAAESWIRGFPNTTRAYALALRLTLIASTVLVLLSFRRSLWAYVVLTIIVVGFWGIRTSRAGRATAMRLLGALGLLAIIAVLALGPEKVYERVESFSPSAENRYTATNEDHVNDVRDALTVIATEPLLGLGIGTTYETELISEWKTESFEVHNAFIHSWLKFGLLGLITYVGFHIALGLALYRLGGRGAMGFVAAGISVFTEQVVSLVQTWPYGGFAYTLAKGVVIGIFLACWKQNRPDHETRGATGMELQTSLG